MPQKHVIHIKGINFFDKKKLKLDKPKLKAFSGDTIEWKISTSEVESLEKITEKTGISNVWKQRPHSGNNWIGIIDENAPINYKYKYNIKWKRQNNGQTYVHDPKIAINPTGGFSDNLLISFITLMGLTSILFWINKKRRK